MTVFNCSANTFLQDGLFKKHYFPSVALLLQNKWLLFIYNIHLYDPYSYAEADEFLI